MSTGCEVYNLGTGKGTSVLEMVSAFEKASGKVKDFPFYAFSFATDELDDAEKYIFVLTLLYSVVD